MPVSHVETGVFHPYEAHAYAHASRVPDSTSSSVTRPSIISQEVMDPWALRHWIAPALPLSELDFMSLLSRVKPNAPLCNAVLNFRTRHRMEEEPGHPGECHKVRRWERFHRRCGAPLVAKRQSMSPCNPGAAFIGKKARRNSRNSN